jgi:hypothetical protein
MRKQNEVKNLKSRSKALDFNRQIHIRGEGN